MQALPQPTTEELDLVAVLHALADPTRLELVRDLARHQQPYTCNVGAYHLDITAATLSHHWKVLREAGITTTYASGRNRLIELRRADLGERFPGLLDVVLRG